MSYAAWKRMIPARKVHTANVLELTPLTAINHCRLWGVVTLVRLGRVDSLGEFD
jgi:hypothetical protein